ncbi:two-component system, response regulator YcbB [Dethiosulfatibacter aminovorans DSM 17477]|uniref:Two-component system, response regulator YcbB n=1 Tax=Dethiosulfatibacter aminovorans DSM 17477 TaxID=1121476 RepID=A0A1M6BTZ0_9FIRM|nr:response regulator [Dethiosulfatibacter aminovorans]SHI52014.1 two-component system, response regulator YcbB [Dethiosulfatibacter aminovorans DSM 17477]
MLRIYIVDDDISAIKVLENIIEDNDLGEVIGFSLGGEAAVDEILSLEPDIVLIDLLMPEKDGIEMVNDIRKHNESIKFIMISHVNTKNMISSAYKSGIEFFINKPINNIEVKIVMEKIAEKINMEKIFSQISSVVVKKEKASGRKDDDDPVTDIITSIRRILNRLGILGEKGGEDILKVCRYLVENKVSIYDYRFKDICKKLTDDNPKAMEQRIRRAVNMGLNNLANIGIEDYMNITFTRYSNSLYNFQDVKAQMDYIRGNRMSGGKINVKKFIDNLMANQELREN